MTALWTSFSLKPADLIRFATHCQQTGNSCRFLAFYKAWKERGVLLAESKDDWLDEWEASLPKLPKLIRDLIDPLVDSLIRNELWMANGRRSFSIDEWEGTALGIPITGIIVSERADAIQKITDIAQFSNGVTIVDPYALSDDNIGALSALCLVLQQYRITNLELYSSHDFDEFGKTCTSNEVQQRFFKLIPPNLSGTLKSTSKGSFGSHDRFIAFYRQESTLHKKVLQLGKGVATFKGGMPLTLSRVPKEDFEKIFKHLHKNPYNGWKIYRTPTPPAPPALQSTAASSQKDTPLKPAP
jgi:hypothetical protein